MAEIHSLAEFKLKSENHLYFSGQAKTRDAENASDNYEIYTLFPALLMVRALEYLELCDRRLSKLLQENEPKACNKAFAMALSRSLRGYPNITYKSLRALYADILWQLKKDIYESKGIEKHTIYSEWLGHISQDGAMDSTFMSYMIYQIKDFNQVRNLVEKQPPFFKLFEVTLWTQNRLQ